jgi:putative hydrolase of the HAD superfamily
MWRGCVLEVLGAHEPDHEVDEETIRGALRDGFPWHRPDQPHPQLSDPRRWWAEVEVLIARAFEAAGVASGRSRELARLVHELYVDHRRGWRLYEEAVEVLEELRSAGWRHIILSNHVPELPAMVDGLGLGGVVEEVLTSAAIGYEKPHPEAFRIARRTAGSAERLWMIGDNPVSDVGGAEAAGIPAIRVHGEPGPGRWAPTLRDVQHWLEHGDTSAAPA